MGGGGGPRAWQIEATDRQIDGLVYELYGLTEVEIGVWWNGRPDRFAVIQILSSFSGGMCDGHNPLR